MRDTFATFNQHRTKFKFISILVLISIVMQTQGANNNNNNANDPKYIFGEGSKQISDINLLLPISTCADCRKVTYSLSAINGCYSW